MANYKTRNKQLDKQTKLGFAILGVLAVLLCCGGITAVGALTDSGQESFKDGFQAASGTDATGRPTPTVASTTPTVKPTTAKPAPKKTTASPKPVYYPNCTAVRNAGKAPLRKGQPGYRTALDRDRDGRACEASEGPAPGTGGDNDDGDDPPASVYYENCAAVRAAGKAPIYRGQPGFGPHLDRDGDGKACE